MSLKNMRSRHRLKKQSTTFPRCTRQYSKKYPELFENGKLVDIETAKEKGIITEVSAVPLGDEEVVSGHISTKSDATPFGFTYNTESQSVEVQKFNANQEKDFRRLEKLDEDFEVPEMTAKEEDNL